MYIETLKDFTDCLITVHLHKESDTIRIKEEHDRGHYLTQIVHGNTEEHI